MGHKRNKKNLAIYFFSNVDLSVKKVLWDLFRIKSMED